MNGDQGEEMIAGGTMMDHQGAVPRLPEEVLHQGEDLLPEEREELGGGEMLLQEDHHQGVQEEEMMDPLEGLRLQGEMLVKEEDLHQGVWVIDLRPEETLVVIVMMTG